MGVGLLLRTVIPPSQLRGRKQVQLSVRKDLLIGRTSASGGKGLGSPPEVGAEAGLPLGSDVQLTLPDASYLVPGLARGPGTQPYFRLNSRTHRLMTMTLETGSPRES